MLDPNHCLIGTRRQVQQRLVAVARMPHATRTAPRGWPRWSRSACRGRVLRLERLARLVGEQPFDVARRQPARVHLDSQVLQLLSPAPQFLTEARVERLRSIRNSIDPLALFSRPVQ